MNNKLTFLEKAKNEVKKNEIKERTIQKNWNSCESN